MQDPSASKRLATAGAAILPIATALASAGDTGTPVPFPLGISQMAAGEKLNILVK